MAGRGGKFVNGGYERIVYMPCYEECDFKASLPVYIRRLFISLLSKQSDRHGSNRKDLTQWVRYAKQTGSVDFL